VIRGRFRPRTRLNAAVPALPWVCTAASLWLSCNGEAPAPVPEPAAPAPASPPLQEQAQRKAYGELLPAAQALFVEANPRAAFTLGLGPLRPTGSADRDRLDAAWRDAEQIAPRFLDAEQAAILRAVVFGLDRERGRARRPPLARRDPMWGPSQLRAAWEAAVEAWARGELTDAAPLFTAMDATIRRAAEELGAASPATLRAAEQELTALAASLATHPLAASAGAPASALQTTLRETAMAWAARQRELAAAQEIAYATPIARLREGEALRRLPPRWGATELARRLADDEHLGTTPEALFVALGPTIARLAQLRDASAEQAPQGPATPVDAVRCAGFEFRFVGLRAQQPALAQARLDCASAIRRWHGQAMTDAAFMLAGLQWAALEPRRNARRREELTVLALLEGSIAPASQRHAQRVALATAFREPAVVHQAARAAHEVACLAATALWIHGELGSDDELRERLSSRCGPTDAADWIARAEADPWGALGGLELWRLGHGPAESVALDHFWWLPAGLIDPLMRPHDPSQGPAISVHTEELSP